MAPLAVQPFCKVQAQRTYYDKGMREKYMENKYIRIQNIKTHTHIYIYTEHSNDKDNGNVDL